MTDQNNNRGGAGVFTILQIIFALCYYADPCPDNKCATKIATWNPWYVWLPTIIPTGIYALVVLCKSIPIRKKTHLPFYNIEPLTVSPLGEVSATPVI